MLGLLDTFDAFLGRQFPCVDVTALKAEVSQGGGKSFIMYCVCGLAARYDIRRNQADAATDSVKTLQLPNLI
jgi:hypothetical protein